MNVTIAAQQESPLCSILTKDARTENPFVYSIAKSTKPVSFESVEVAPNSSSIGFGNESHFFIPRISLLKAANLRLVLKQTGKTQAGDGATPEVFTAYQNTLLPDWFGLACIKKVKLTTSSRVISELTGEAIWGLIMDMSKEQRDNYAMGLIENPSTTEMESAATGTDKYLYLNIPMLFPHFSSFSTYLDTRFLAPLALEVTFNTTAVAVGTGIVGTTTPYTGKGELGDGRWAIDGDRTRMVCHYASMSEPDYKALQKAQFPLGKNLVQLSSSFYTESNTKGAATSGAVKLSTELKCNSVVTRTYFCIRKSEEIDSTTNTLQQRHRGVDLGKSVISSSGDVDRVSVTASGRDIIPNIPLRELAVVWNSGRALAYTSGTSQPKPSSQCFCIDWSLYDDAAVFSGALSLAVLSAPTLSVQVNNGTGTTNYTLSVWHQYLHLQSVSSSDGSIQIQSSV